MYSMLAFYFCSLRTMFNLIYGWHWFFFSFRHFFSFTITCHFKKHDRYLKILRKLSQDYQQQFWLFLASTAEDTFVAQMLWQTEPRKVLKRWKIFSSHEDLSLFNDLARCVDLHQLTAGTSAPLEISEVDQLTVYAGRSGPGGAGDLASPAGAAGSLPGDCPSGNAAVSIEHHYLTGPHRQLACQIQEGGKKGFTLL